MIYVPYSDYHDNLRLMEDDLELSIKVTNTSSIQVSKMTMYLRKRWDQIRYRGFRKAKKWKNMTNWRYHKAKAAVVLSMIADRVSEKLRRHNRQEEEIDRMKGPITSAVRVVQDRSALKTDDWEEQQEERVVSLAGKLMRAWVNSITLMEEIEKCLRSIRRSAKQMAIRRGTKRKKKKPKR